MRRSYPVLLLFIFAMAACKADHENTVTNDEDKILGVWIKTPLDPIARPADTLYFSKKAGGYFLNFDCSGAPVANWPKRAETPYKFENGKLSYLNYADSSNGFVVASSFRWITPGKEFEIFRRHLILYMAAEYLVRYTRLQ